MKKILAIATVLLSFSANASASEVYGNLSYSYVASDNNGGVYQSPISYSMNINYYLGIYTSYDFFAGDFEGAVLHLDGTVNYYDPAVNLTKILYFDQAAYGFLPTMNTDSYSNDNGVTVYGYTDPNPREYGELVDDGLFAVNNGVAEQGEGLQDVTEVTPGSVFWPAITSAVDGGELFYGSVKCYDYGVSDCNSVFGSDFSNLSYLRLDFDFIYGSFVLVDNNLAINFLSEDGGHGYLFSESEISSVPIPGALWLFSSALIGLVGFKRKR